MASLIEGDRVIERLPPVEMLPRLTQRAVDSLALSSRARPRNPAGPFFPLVALTSPHTQISAPACAKFPRRAPAICDGETDRPRGQILSLPSIAMASSPKTRLSFSPATTAAPSEAGVDKLEAAGHFASAQYRGYKADGWEGGHRVPFLVHCMARSRRARATPR